MRRNLWNSHSEAERRALASVRSLAHGTHCGACYKVLGARGGASFVRPSFSLPRTSSPSPPSLPPPHSRPIYVSPSFTQVCQTKRLASGTSRAPTPRALPTRISHMRVSRPSKQPTRSSASTQSGSCSSGMSIILPVFFSSSLLIPRPILHSLGLAAYIYSLDGTTTYSYLSFATSSFGGHTLVSTIQTAQSIISASRLRLSLSFRSTYPAYSRRWKARHC